MAQVTGARVGRELEPKDGARREEILEAATTLFAEQGYSDCLTQVLAERLQVGKGTIYRYFPSKRDLFLASADRVMRRLRAHIEERVEGIDEPFLRIQAGIRAFLSFFANHPELVELLVQERALFRDRKKPTYYEHREKNVARWRELYQSLMAAGQLRQMPIDRILDVITDLLYGTIFNNYFAGREKPLEDQVQDILDVLFRGILGDSERARLEPGTSPAAASETGPLGTGSKTPQ
jgi:AcrR family transcriptional regulator